MPEYLAPGVYVEEIDTGSKPIEGVSTSTAGLVGVTERGPAHVPLLVTSFGDYFRVFGGTLDAVDFVNPPGRGHYFLPHAVEGFFVNGGKRTYVTRVIAQSATRAQRRLFFFDPAVANPGETHLLRPAEQGTGTAVNQPALYVLGTQNLVVGEIVRVGDGSRAEYHAIAAVGGNALHVTLSQPLSRAHPAGTSTVHDIARVVAPFAVFTLAEDLRAGARTILLQETFAGDAAGLVAQVNAPGGVARLEIGVGARAEFNSARTATAVGGTQARLMLDDAVMLAYPSATTQVSVLQIPAAPPAGQALAAATSAGDNLILLDTLAGGYANTARLVVIAVNTADEEIRRIGALGLLDLDVGAYEPYGTAVVVERVTLVDDDRQALAGATATSIPLNDARGLAPGMTLTFTIGAGPATSPGVLSVVDVNTNTVTVQAPLPGAPGANTPVLVPPKQLTALAEAGTVVLSLNDRLGLGPGHVLRVGAAPDEEYVTIREVVPPRGVPPDAGTIVLSAALREDHPAGTLMRRQNPPVVDVNRQIALLVLPTPEGGDDLLVSDATNFAANEIVRVTVPGANQYYHRLIGITPVAPRGLTLVGALERSHGAGAPVVQRFPILEARALDHGAWGNRVLVSVAEEEDGLLARAEITAATPSPGPGIPSTIRLTTTTGVEAGTVLEVSDPAVAGLTLPLLKVRLVDRAANNLLILDPPGLTPAHLAAFNAAQLAGRRLVARSRDFRLEVLVRRPPDPAVPTRNEDILDSERFDHLSMDPRHSRYVERVIGATWVDGNPQNEDQGQPPRQLRRWDRRSEGESQYLRVRDLAANAADREAIRLGPEALEDLLPSGLPRAARHPLGEGEELAVRGDDSIFTMNDAMYLGVDDRQPERRTGIFTLKNYQNISLVAAPGQTTVPVQQALIDHCEEMRYRFAVLDSQGPTLDSIADVQAQRQQFDTKYAALYYPWLTIPDPRPRTAIVRQMPIPPTGHVLGIFARSDNERGVHKAPANEVVRGITGITRLLNKGEHDILNPYPVHVNVIRDFRPNNRGIRVWGARCITSDNDYKYVNVRRLLIFLEDSIDRGLQWVVFEPNAEELWARVRRSITNFLTVVWRNGALEGTTPEQGFFVKCDRTTMTQTDIDNGRLICVIGVAPVKPAEFVIIRIGLWTAEARR